MSAPAPTVVLPPSDEVLSAWLDGELNKPDRDIVEAWLNAHPDDAAKVRLWVADRDALVARFESVIEEPVPTRLEQIVWNQAPMSATRLVWTPRLYRLAAAIAIFGIGLGVGGGVAWRMLGSADGPAVATNGWVQRAAVAHAVYTPEVRHPVEVAVGPAGTPDNAAQEAHLAGWLTKRLGTQVKLFDLGAQGFDLVGGRLLPDSAGPSAQLMYERRAEPGTRVTIYLRKPRVGRPDTDAPASFSFERQGELNTFYWVEGATGYALVGSLPREQLLALAESIYRQGR